MSQLYKNNAGGVVPVTGVLELTPDSGAAVVPDGSGNINLTGVTSTDTNFETFNAGLSTMSFAHRWQGTATTVGAATSTIVSIPVTVASVQTVLALLAGIEASGPNGVGGQITGVVFRAGGAPVVLTTSDTLIGSSAPLVGSNFNVSVSGNNLVVTVTGVLGFTIEWNCIVTLCEETFI